METSQRGYRMPPPSCFSFAFRVRSLRSFAGRSACNFKGNSSRAAALQGHITVRFAFRLAGALAGFGGDAWRCGERVLTG